MSVRLLIFRSLLEPLRGGRLLDLGTGHEKFALIAQELGWHVTAVDARTERMPMTPGIDWVQADVRDFPLDGYDCICVLGLLYHLELPDQLDLLRRASSPLAIVDTHYSVNPKTTELGYRGQWFDEKVEAPTASWGNKRSFWPTEEDLLRMFHDCGFISVWKLVPPYHENRNFFVAQKAVARTVRS